MRGASKGGMSAGGWALRRRSSILSTRVRDRGRVVSGRRSGRLKGYIDVHNGAQDCFANSGEGRAVYASTLSHICKQIAALTCLWMRQR